MEGQRDRLIYKIITFWQGSLSPVGRPHISEQGNTPLNNPDCPQS